MICDFTIQPLKPDLIVLVARILLFSSFSHLNFVIAPLLSPYLVSIFFTAGLVIRFLILGEILVSATSAHFPCCSRPIYQCICFLLSADRFAVKAFHRYSLEYSLLPTARHSAPVLQNNLLL